MERWNQKGTPTLTCGPPIVEPTNLPSLLLRNRSLNLDVRIWIWWFWCVALKTSSTSYRWDSISFRRKSHCWYSLSIGIVVATYGEFWKRHWQHVVHDRLAVMRANLEVRCETYTIVYDTFIQQHCRLCWDKWHHRFSPFFRLIQKQIISQSRPSHFSRSEWKSIVEQIWIGEHLFNWKW